MRILSILIYVYIIVITSSVQNLYASESRPVLQKPLIEELYANFPYYVEYLSETADFYSNLSPHEQQQLLNLRLYLKNQRQLPELHFTEDRQQFYLQENEPERMAKTTQEEWSPIEFNASMLADESMKITIPLMIQILIHELGHKLNESHLQADIDSLATKASLYFKAYTSEFKVGNIKFHALSLPIRWFPWVTPMEYGVSNRHRPNSAIFSEIPEQGFLSLTRAIYERLNQVSGAYWAAGDTQPQAFTDKQTYIYGWDVSRDRQISALVKVQKRLQPKDGKIFNFDYEVYGKSVYLDQHLVMTVSEDQQQLDIQTAPSGLLDLENTIQTSMQQEGRFYKLELPQNNLEEGLLLRLMTDQGPVLLAPEKSTDGAGPLVFRFQVSPNRAPGFIEIHSVVKSDGTFQFLDKFYWYATGSEMGSRFVNKAQARFMQMQVNTKWKKIKMENGFIRNRWGETAIRIQLQKYKKIRHIRLVWQMSRKHYQSHRLKQPYINNPFEQRYVQARGYFGGEHAVEYEFYEDVITEKQLQQGGRTLTIPLEFYPKHIKSDHTASYMMYMGGIMGSYTTQVTTQNILAEDLGDRQLVDILVTDENMETTSLVKEGQVLSFAFNKSGLSECEEYLLKRKQYYEFSDLNVKGSRRNRKPWTMP